MKEVKFILLTVLYLSLFIIGDILIDFYEDIVEVLYQEESMQRIELLRWTVFIAISSVYGIELIKSEDRK